MEGDWDADGAFRRYTYGRNFACHVLGFVKTHSRAEGAEGLVVGQMGIKKRPLTATCAARGRAWRPWWMPAIASSAAWATATPFPSTGCRTWCSAWMPEIRGIVEETLDDHIQRGLVPPCGAVVVMDPHTGDILAMASRPVISGEKNHYNRATRKSDKVAMLPWPRWQNSSPPLPPWKGPCPVPPMARLPREREFNCVFGPHGQQDMARALANSCNTYFAELAAQVGARELLAMAKALGLGPKKRHRPARLGGRRRQPARAAGPGHQGRPDQPLAMGRETNWRATPLQVAAMLSAIANGSWYVEPRLVLATGRGEIAEVTAPPPKRERVMSPTTAQLLARMMHLSVREGSAGHFDHAAYPYAAAQLASRQAPPMPGFPPTATRCGGMPGSFPGATPATWWST